MVTSSFGHGDVLLWFFEIFLFVVWFRLLINIFADLFRDQELSGVKKALWILAVLLFPLFGILGYLILRGEGMGTRALKSLHESQERFDAYIRSVATPSAPEQIQKAKALLDAGAIDLTEYTRLKAKALQ